jgi:hypothetical protein
MGGSEAVKEHRVRPFAVLIVLVAVYAIVAALIVFW